MIIWVRGEGGKNEKRENENACAGPGLKSHIDKGFSKKYGA